MNEPPETRALAGYFIPVVAVLGGALLMPPFPIFFTTIGPLLLLVLTPVLLIEMVRYREARRIQARRQEMEGAYTSTSAMDSHTQVGR